MTATGTIRGGRAPRVGIVGAGQLARMTVQAAIGLGVEVHLLAANADDGAAQVCRNVAIGAPDDYAALQALAERCDVVTFDHELVDVAQLRELERAGHTVYPRAGTVAVAQDKARQHALWAEKGLPAPAHRPAADARELVAFGDRYGWPLVAKAARGGYDGRGVWTVAGPTAARELVSQATANGVALLAEQRIPIERELAVLIARRPRGETALYPVVETVQREGICHELIVPARIDPALAAEAERIGLAAAEAAGATGIFAVELFVAGGRLLINEVAARPHNSGHFSLGGCVASQFENHLRAVLDWPLGDPSPLAPVVVTHNILAAEWTTDLCAGLPAALATPGAQVHLYGKQPRRGRKVGHVTVLGDEVEEARGRAARAVAALGGVIASGADQRTPPRDLLSRGGAARAAAEGA